MSKQKLHIFFTSDIHGNYFGHEFRHKRPGRGGLPRVHAYVSEQVAKGDGAVLLFDGGDLLQGDLAAYTLNYLPDPAQRGERVARMMDYVGYDAVVVGNHDIEAGLDVVRNFGRHCGIPQLAANIVDEATGEPAFQPYELFVRGGWRVAVLGLCTQTVPSWVPRDRREGLRFLDVADTVASWVPRIREAVRPDLLVAVVHSGMDGGMAEPNYHENDVRRTVETVGGIDLVLYGHDHHAHVETLVDPDGRGVVCVNPGCQALNVAHVTVTEDAQNGAEDEEGKATPAPHIEVELVDISLLRNPYSMAYGRHFRQDYHAVEQMARRVVAQFPDDVIIRDAFSGPSPYVDFLQQIMLQATGAQVAFASPVFVGRPVPAGAVTPSVLSRLYHLDDRLFVLRMSGREIRDYLEYSYSLWVKRMERPDDSVLLLQPLDDHSPRMIFQNYIFNFDSAAGIRYGVDVTRPAGQFVDIRSMADGSPFNPDATYEVCMTGYRASGGGELITRGAGISRDELESRLVRRMPQDVGHTVANFMRSHPEARPAALRHWAFEPQEWTEPALARDYVRLGF